MTPRTIFDKIWDGHTVQRGSDGVDLLYVDLHLVHEVTSPQAFEGMRIAGRRVRRPELTVATADHGVPTTGRELGILDPMSARQIGLLERNCRDNEIAMFGLDDPRQGIVHVVGPEQGLTQPGMVIVCGDSHTSTHGAVGALAFGIGTTEVEHVLATQTLVQTRPKTLALDIDGALPQGVDAKDLILAIIAEMGISGAARHVIEYRGAAIRRLSMEQRMTICNMSIEAGARAGLIAPDETTFGYLEGRPSAPAGADWRRALDAWQALPSDIGAEFDATVVFDASTLAPQVTWGTNPAQTVSVTAAVPDPAALADTPQRDSAERALRYMGLAPGTPMTDITIDRVFLGSCTNARIEDLRTAARIVAGRRVGDRVTAIAVPGSMAVKAQAEAEGLDRIFVDAGFEWRDAGCSSCLGMNDDIVGPGERCASTSNRNFEGRQGPRARTHLVSPAMAAAAAVTGHFVDVRTWSDGS